MNETEKGLYTQDGDLEQTIRATVVNAQGEYIDIGLTERITEKLVAVLASRPLPAQVPTDSARELAEIIVTDYGRANHATLESTRLWELHVDEVFALVSSFAARCVELQTKSSPQVEALLAKYSEQRKLAERNWNVFADTVVRNDKRLMPTCQAIAAILFRYLPELEHALAAPGRSEAQIRLEEAKMWQEHVSIARSLPGYDFRKWLWGEQRIAELESQATDPEGKK